MNSYFVESINSGTKKFYIVDKNNNPVYECKDAGIFKGYTITRCLDNVEIAEIQFKQRFIFWNYVIDFKLYNCKISVRESILGNYIFKGANIKVESLLEPEESEIDENLNIKITKGKVSSNVPISFSESIYEEEEKIAELTNLMDNIKLREIKIYNEKKLDFIVSIVIGMLLCNSYSRHLNRKRY